MNVKLLTAIINFATVLLEAITKHFPVGLF